MSIDKIRDFFNQGLNSKKQSDVENKKNEFEKKKNELHDKIKGLEKLDTEGYFKKLISFVKEEINNINSPEGLEDVTSMINEAILSFSDGANKTEEIESTIGANTQSITKQSGNIDLSTSNAARLSTVSGDIKILGDNSGEVSIGSGDIKIGGKNSGEVSTGSGDIKIPGDNSGEVSTRSGDIKIGGKNDGEVSTGSGKITIGGRNYSKLNASHIVINAENIEMYSEGGNGNSSVNISTVSGNGNFISQGNSNIVSNVTISNIGGGFHVGNTYNSNNVPQQKTYIISYQGQIARIDFSTFFQGTSERTESKTGIVFTKKSNDLVSYTLGNQSCLVNIASGAITCTYKSTGEQSSYNKPEEKIKTKENTETKESARQTVGDTGAMKKQFQEETSDIIDPYLSEVITDKLDKQQEKGYTALVEYCYTQLSTISKSEKSIRDKNRLIQNFTVYIGSMIELCQNKERINKLTGSTGSTIDSEIRGLENAKKLRIENITRGLEDIQADIPEITIQDFDSLTTI